MLDDCFLHDKQRMTHAQALEKIRWQIPRRVGREAVPLADASGRVLDEDITALRDIPAFANAAVDGYAYDHADALKHGGVLGVAARIAAGEGGDIQLGPGQCARIFTGARMPHGANTIAMQEDCEPMQGECVQLPLKLKSGANVRAAGEDIAAGDLALSAGLQLDPPAIARLASLGLERVMCTKRLSVGVISSGNEVVAAGAPLQSGQVYDVNTPLLCALLRSLPVSISPYRILRDDRTTVEATLAEAAERHDLLITSGGASMGEEDHLVRTLDRLGRRHLWQIAVKPGRPLSFGHIGKCAVCMLPGNPVAVLVCFVLYARAVILQLSGANWSEPERYGLPAGFNITQKKPDRREFYRGIFKADPSGRMRLEKFPRDGSGLISGLTAANGLIEVAETVTTIREGDVLPFIPFSQFF